MIRFPWHPLASTILLSLIGLGWFPVAIGLAVYAASRFHAFGQDPAAVIQSAINLEGISEHGDSDATRHAFNETIRSSAV